MADEKIRLSSLEAERLKEVHITVRDEGGYVRKYTCYDDGEGVVKERDGMVWVRELQPDQHSGEKPVPRWIPAAPSRLIASMEILDWPPER